MASLYECMDMEKANAEHGIVYMFNVYTTSICCIQWDFKINIDKLPNYGIMVQKYRNLWCKRRKTDAQQRWCVSGVTNIMSDAQSDEATQHIRPLHVLCLKVQLTKEIQGIEFNIEYTYPTIPALRV